MTDINNRVELYPRFKKNILEMRFVHLLLSGERLFIEYKSRLSVVCAFFRLTLNAHTFAYFLSFVFM